MSVDISVVTTFHREGALVEASLNSILLAVDHARDHGLEVEEICVLDRADIDTQDNVRKLAPVNASIFNTEYGDPGLSRNFGILASKGDFVSIIDGDDMISSNWLTAAHAQALRFQQAVICHPGIEIYFGERTLLRVAYDSDDPEFSCDCLLEDTVWPVTALARRQVYLKHPFEPCNWEAGYAHEDTLWNCETIAAGICHKLVPETFFCYRVKPPNLSLNSLSRQNNCLMGPSRLFQLPFQIENLSKD